jgi:hypothetical protein
MFLEVLEKNMEALGHDIRSLSRDLYPVQLLDHDDTLDTAMLHDVMSYGTCWIQ